MSLWIAVLPSFNWDISHTGVLQQECFPPSLDYTVNISLKRISFY